MEENWNSIMHACEVTTQQTTGTMVKWIKTPVLSVKLNSNGSCVEGKCGGEGIIRDYQGFTIFAYSMQLGPGTSNIAEAAALLFGLKWCAHSRHDIV